MMPRRQDMIQAGLCRFLLCAGVCIWVSACNLFEDGPVTMVPLSIPGAEYVGSETCSTSDCHQAEHRYFNLNKHASVSIDISDEEAEAGQAEGCETCHGPGSVHAVKTKPKYGRAEAKAACAECHTRDHSPDFDETKCLDKIKHWEIPGSIERARAITARLSSRGG